jgi:hypothetical protein
MVVIKAYYLMMPHFIDDFLPIVVALVVYVAGCFGLHKFYACFFKSGHTKPIT